MAIGLTRRRPRATCATRSGAWTTSEPGGSGCSTTAQLRRRPHPPPARRALRGPAGLRPRPRDRGARARGRGRDALATVSGERVAATSCSTCWRETEAPAGGRPPGRPGRRRGAAPALRADGELVAAAAARRAGDRRRPRRSPAWRRSPYGRRRGSGTGSARWGWTPAERDRRARAARTAPLLAGELAPRPCVRRSSTRCSPRAARGAGPGAGARARPPSRCCATSATSATPASRSRATT